VGARLEPAHAALAVGTTLEIVNETDDAHSVSCPAGGLVRRLGPGESAAVGVGGAGEWTVFVLDVPGERTDVFAAPGRFAVVSASGRWELAGLAPGRRRLGAWHPRFPPAWAEVAIEPGRSERVDFELRVDRREEGSDAP
jgi:hypothetical protein